MKKRILILALAVSMALEPAAAYGAEFSSGTQEETPENSWGGGKNRMGNFGSDS